MKCVLFNVDYNEKHFHNGRFQRLGSKLSRSFPIYFVVQENCAVLALFWRPPCSLIEGYHLIADIFGAPQADTENEWRQRVWRRRQGRRSSSYTGSCGLAAACGSQWRALHQVSSSCLCYLQVCSSKIKAIKDWFSPREQNIVTDST